MKKRLALTLAACAMCIGAQAQTAHSTKSTLVQATVLDTCKFERPGDSVTLGLGPLDPSNGAAASQSQAVKFSCTNGYTVAVGIAGQAMTQADHPRSLTHKTFAAQTIPYTLSLRTPGGTTGRGFGLGNELSLDLLAQVAAGDYANALGGAYEDAVVIELRP